MNIVYICFCSLTGSCISSWKNFNIQTQQMDEKVFSISCAQRMHDLCVIQVCKKNKPPIVYQNSYALALLVSNAYGTWIYIKRANSCVQDRSLGSISLITSSTQYYIPYKITLFQQHY